MAMRPADSIVADRRRIRSSSANLRSSRCFAALPNHRCGEACDKRQVEGFVFRISTSLIGSRSESPLTEAGR